jgi:hypothetical protein
LALALSWEISGASGQSGIALALHTAELRGELRGARDRVRGSIEDVPRVLNQLVQ